MSKHEKLLEKIFRTPTPRDLRWTEVVSCLQSLGFSVINGDGSRRRFHNEQTNVTFSIHEPHPEPELKIYVVKIIKESLEKHLQGVELK
jgi:predicted RNA binding protein YcfA (HicA-like mRNA interferase family)